MLRLVTSILLLAGVASAQLASNRTSFLSNHRGGWPGGRNAGVAIPKDSRLKLWLKSESLSGADGALISSWADSSGNANNASASGAARPTLNLNPYGGFSSLNFSPNASQGMDISNIACTGRACSIFLVYWRPAGASRFAVSAESAIGAISPYLIVDFANGTGAGAGKPIAQVSGHADGVWMYTDRLVPSRPDVISFVAGASNTKMAVNGDSTTGAQGGGSTTNINRIGYNFGYGAGDLFEVIVYNAELTTAEVAQVTAYLMKKYATARTTYPYIMLIGNSLITGYTLTPSTSASWPGLVSAALGFKSEVVSASATGRTTPQLTTDYPVSAGPSYSTAYGKNIAVIWEGTNDIFTNGVNATTAYNNLVTLNNAAKATGYTTIVATILPRAEAGTCATFETTRLAANALIMGDGALGDFKANIGADATIGAPGCTAATDVSLYAGGNHLTVTATRLYALPYFLNAISAITGK